MRAVSAHDTTAVCPYSQSSCLSLRFSVCSIRQQGPQSTTVGNVLECRMQLRAGQIQDSKNSRLS